MNFNTENELARLGEKRVSMFHGIKRSAAGSELYRVYNYSDTKCADDDRYSR